MALKPTLTSLILQTRVSRPSRNLFCEGIASGFPAFLNHRMEILVHALQFYHHASQGFKFGLNHGVILSGPLLDASSLNRTPYSKQGQGKQLDPSRRDQKNQIAERVIQPGKHPQDSPNEEDIKGPHGSKSLGPHGGQLFVEMSNKLLVQCHSLFTKREHSFYWIVSSSSSWLEKVSMMVFWRLYRVTTASS